MQACVRASVAQERMQVGRTATQTDREGVRAMQTVVEATRML